MFANVFSLDAPLIAVVWLYVFSWIWDVNYVEPLLPVVLALVVWIVYATDRLLDGKLHQTSAFPLRHLVHRYYEKKFQWAIMIAALATLVISLNVLQWSIVQTAMLPLAATAGFFVLSFFSSSTTRVSYSKNLLAGYAFAWGVGAGLIGLLGLPQPMNLFKLLAPEMLVFGLMCVINITAVDLWIKGSDELDDEGNEWALTLPLMMLAFFSVLMMRTVHKEQYHPFYISMLISAALMYVVNRMRHRFSADLLRVIADLITLVAALFFFLMH
ncbi:MAG: hypothetical protein RI957_1280 [Verrucomicrobiota bacterium]